MGHVWFHWSSRGRYETVSMRVWGCEGDLCPLTFDLWVRVDRQGWSSGLIVRVDRQGWSSGLIVRVDRQSWSSGYALLWPHLRSLPYTPWSLMILPGLCKYVWGCLGSSGLIVRVDRQGWSSGLIVRVDRQVWSSGLIVRVDRQGWSSGLIVRVDRQGWSSGLIVRVDRQGTHSCDPIWGRYPTPRDL